MLPSVSSPPRPTSSAFSAAESVRTGAGSWWRTVTAVLRTPRSWPLRWKAFAVLAALYIALTLLVLIPGTPVLHLDSYMLNLHMWHNHPQWYPWVSVVVGFGQRWIMTYVLQLVFVWAALRARSTRPLVLFVTAIIVLNVSVGIVKYAVGRIGPIRQNDPHLIFHLGGSLFPSGHVSNTVVLYGVLAWAVPQYRKWLIGFTCVIAACVGLGTVFMRTHWFSDVMGGWLAGSMILLAVPSVMPYAQRFADLLEDRIRAGLATRPRLDDCAHRLYRWALRHVSPHTPSVAVMRAGQRQDRARLPQRFRDVVVLGKD